MHKKCKNTKKQAGGATDLRTLCTGKQFKFKLASGTADTEWTIESTTECLTALELQNSLLNERKSTPHATRVFLRSRSGRHRAS